MAVLGDRRQARVRGERGRRGRAEAGGRRVGWSGEVAQGIADLARARRALRRGAGQEGVAEVVEGLGDAVAGDLPQAGRSGAHLLADDPGQAVAVPQSVTGDRLPEDHSEGVEVCPRVDPIADRLLGRHVARGPEDQAEARQGLAGVGAGHRRLGAEARDPEVEDDRQGCTVVPLADDDVVGLEIAVDDPEVVGGGEGVGDLGRDLRGSRPGEGALVEESSQRGAAGELGDQVGAALGELAVVDG